MTSEPACWLEEMDEQQAAEFLSQQLATLSADQEYALRHEDYVMEIPQSGERIRGREAMRAFQKAYPDDAPPPSIRVRRVLVRDALWVVEGVSDYAGRVYDVIDIIELRDNCMWARPLLRRPV